MPTARTSRSFTTVVDRKQLLAALRRVGWVVPRRTVQPILKAVRLATSGGVLRLSGTDLEVSLTVTVNAEGRLPPSLVDGAEFTRRVSAGKADGCSLALDATGGTLTINGGRVEHRLPTLDVREYPPVPVEPEGDAWRAEAQEFRRSLAVALLAAATEENTRYAVNGVLLEADRNGSRLVATDGRRLVVVELNRRKGPFRGQVILPRHVATLTGKLIGPQGDGLVEVFIKPHPDGAPADLCVTGPDWRLFAKAVEGLFPAYRDVIPPSHSRFIVNRSELLEILHEVALPTDEDATSVRFDLRADGIRLSAGSAAAGESSGVVPAEFAGGGDDRIITAFRPGYVADALKLLPGERLVIDVEQNQHRPADRWVSGRPAVLQSVESSVIRWLLMPVALDLPPSRETLGSHFNLNDEEPASISPS
jgi:DNA polymerase III subunit beta